MDLSNIENPPFPLVRYTDDDGESRLYRLVYCDDVRKQLVLYDLRQDETTSRVREFTIRCGTRDECQIVAEGGYSTERMHVQRLYDRELEERKDAEKKGCERKERDIKPPKLQPGDKETWKIRKRLVLEFLGVRRRIGGKAAFTFYVDEKWRGTLFKTKALAMGVPTERVKEDYFRGVLYGGDAAALHSNKDQSGARGKPRPAMSGAGRVGPKPAEAKLASKVIDRDGMTEERREEVVILIREIIRAHADDTGMVDVARAKAILGSPTAFWEAYTQRYFTKDVPQRVKDDRPSFDMVNDYRKKALVRGIVVIILEVEEELRREKGLPVRTKVRKARGTVRDRHAGIIESVQLDGVIIQRVRLVWHDPKTKASAPARHPTVVLARGGDPDIILGWHCTVCPERGDAYRYCLYNMFSDKRERLEKLGFDPAQMTGMVPGFAHEFVLDRGPGKSKRVIKYAVRTLLVDASLTLPGVPQQKPGVEGTNHRLKGLLDKLLGIDSLFDRLLSALSVRETITLDKLKKMLPSGVDAIESMIQKRAARQRAKKRVGEIYMSPRAFERLLVVCINILNNRRLKSALARSSEAIANKLPPVPSELYKLKYAIAVKSGAWSPLDDNLRLKLLTIYSDPVRDGKVTHDGCQYGIGANLVGDYDTGAEELSEWLNNHDEAIRYVVPPDKLTIQWLKEEKDGIPVCWVCLNRTTNSTKTYGKDGDLIDIQMANLLRCAEAAAAGRADYSPSDDSVSQEAKLEHQQALREGTTQSSPAERKEAYQWLKTEEEQAQFDQMAAAAGISQNGASADKQTTQPPASKTAEASTPTNVPCVGVKQGAGSDLSFDAFMKMLMEPNSGPKGE
ncbi:hypothetical protein [Cupriavidus basilensis]|uniref:hypothetical protein n=1 Tax=Cupriavidus basilensis TaxID=68895 RepID=UPI00157A7521|nr:hypothetical protein [Cupriavidus basilensis]NUA30271.1 hypothetical protein [Cupriavidus basilensis]